jgi:hypothetical protein
MAIHAALYFKTRIEAGRNQKATGDRAHLWLEKQSTKPVQSILPGGALKVLLVNEMHKIDISLYASFQLKNSNPSLPLQKAVVKPAVI